MFIVHIEIQDQLPILLPGVYTTRTLALSALNANLGHLNRPPLDALTHYPQDDLYTDDPTGEAGHTLSCWISELPVNPPDSVDLVSHTLSGVSAEEPDSVDLESHTLTAEPPAPVSSPAVDVDVTVQVPTLTYENYRVRVNAPLEQASAAALTHMRNTNGESDTISLIGADDHVDIQWASATALDAQPVEGA